MYFHIYILFIVFFLFYYFYLYIIKKCVLYGILHEKKGIAELGPNHWWQCHRVKREKRIERRHIYSRVVGFCFLYSRTDYSSPLTHPPMCLQLKIWVSYWCWFRHSPRYIYKYIHIYTIDKETCWNTQYTYTYDTCVFEHFVLSPSFWICFIWNTNTNT